MAETKSVNTTKLDSSQLAVQGSHNAVLRHFADTVESPTVLAINDTLRVLRLPVDAMVNKLRLAFDDQGTVGAVSIGVAYPTNYAAPGGSAGATIAAGTFATGVSVTSAVAFTDYRFSVQNIDTVHKKLWELAGLSARPLCPELDIIVTATTATDAGATVSALADVAVMG